MAQAARAELGGDPAAKRQTHSARVQLSVDPELVDNLADLLRRTEGRAQPEREAIVTVPFPPGRDPARAVSELRPVLDRWADGHPGVRVQLMPDEGPGRDFASAAGAAAGRGILALTSVARHVGHKRLPQRPEGMLKRIPRRRRRRASPSET